MKTVIMAGGQGTRISSVAADIPKPMITVGNKPVLEHEIECLRKQGFTDIMVTVSHLAQVIMDYFGDGSGKSPVTGEPFGVKIEYYREDVPLGNAGALFRMRDRFTEDFLLLNADSLFDIDFYRFVDYHRRKGGLATLFTHPNSHPYDSGLVMTDADDSVTAWLEKTDERPQYYRNRVNAGLHVISPKLLDCQINASKIDLDRQILKPLAGTGQMYVYESPEYVKDMGTPERYEDVCRDYAAGRIQSKNLRNKQKAVFLDRDGTINRYVGFLSDINEFELLPGVADAIKRINDSGYLAIVITNQPVIARGDVSVEELTQIHNKMETMLGVKGAYLDAVYFCPHHPHSGYIGERAEYKVECECRKPSPGMLLKAAEDFHIDLAQSWMVGDSENDIKAGKAAGCKTVLIGEHAYGQDGSVNSLKDFAMIYL